MIKKISPLLIALVAVFTMTSCLGSEEDETIYYNDTAISAFTLGTLNVTLHTTASDGVTDSTYTATFDGSAYSCAIDQMSATIYNLDSLPINTDVAHVLATITTVNSGTAILNLKDKDGKDSLAYYSSTDSIDFTNPVRIRVYNMKATAYREYTVTLNVHKERGTDFSWNSYSTDALATMGNRKLVNLGSDMFLLSPDGFMKKSGETWNVINANITPSNNIYNNVAVKDGYIYTLSGSQLLRSTDCATWNTVKGSASSVKQLLGATDNYMYALGENTILRSADNGATWESDNLEGYTENLPTSNISFITKASEANDGVTNIVIVGNKDGKGVVWSKTEESDNDVEPWIYYNEDEYITKTLPYMANLQAVKYGDNILATGGDFSKFYVSPDMGLTWEVDTTYNLPDSFGKTASQFTLAVDGSNNLYISKSGSKYVYKARLARLGWTDDKKVFTRARH